MSNDVRRLYVVIDGFPFLTVFHVGRRTSFHSRLQNRLPLEPELLEACGQGHYGRLAETFEFTQHYTPF